MSHKTVEAVTMVPITCMNFTTGTWSFNLNAGIPYQSKAAADETATVNIPLLMPGRRGTEVGVKLKKIEIPIRNTADDFDTAPAPTLYRRNMLANSSADTDMTATTITETDDGDATLDANDRLLTVTVTTPIWDYDTEDKSSYWLSIALDAGTTSVVWVYDALVYWDIIV